MKRHTKRLPITRETIRQLAGADLRCAVGGGGLSESQCESKCICPPPPEAAQ